MSCTGYAAKAKTRRTGDSAVGWCPLRLWSSVLLVDGARRTDLAAPVALAVGCPFRMRSTLATLMDEPPTLTSGRSPSRFRSLESDEFASEELDCINPDYYDRVYDFYS